MAALYTSSHGVTARHKFYTVGFCTEMYVSDGESE
jgi:hypothetical protein